MRRSIVGIILAGITACSLTTNLDGFTGGSGKLDATAADAGPIVNVNAADSSIPNEAATLAPPPIDASGPAAPTLPTGGVLIQRNVSNYGAGGAQKHHVYYAANGGYWAIFYLSAADKTKLFVKVTSDFVHFSDSPALSLPEVHDNDGRNFDVAYASINGSDVFYVAYSVHASLRSSYVVRGYGRNSAFAWGGAHAFGNDVDSGVQLFDPDAPAVALTSDAQVLLSTGWSFVNGHSGNFVTFNATQSDDGTASFAPSFGAGDEIETAAQSVNARMIFPTSFGAVGVWERGDSEPNPTQLVFSGYENGIWDTVNDSGFASVSYDVNDWNAVAVESGAIHAVRWTNDTYEHRLYSTSSTSAGYPIPPATYAAGQGLVLLDLGGQPVMFTLTATDHVLHSSRLEGTTWSAWQDVAAADTKRQNLSGGSSNGVAVVLWEIVNADGTHDLAGLKLQ